MVKYDDKTLISFGAYKGTALANVPAWYLLRALDWNISVPLRQYIKDNQSILEQEAKRSNKFNSR